MWRLLLLHGLERSQRLLEDVMNDNPADDSDDQAEHQPDNERIQDRLLPAFDGGDDWCAAMWTRPRMVADLSAAFVA